MTDRLAPPAALASGHGSASRGALPFAAAALASPHVTQAPAAPLSARMSGQPAGGLTPPSGALPRSEPEARLILTQLLSPAFPVGSYAYSQGLEVAMVAGTVHDAASLQDWVEAVLLCGSGRIDAAFVAWAREPEADLAALAALAYAYAPCRERAEELRDQGASFAACARALGLDTPDLPYPVALGAATARLPLPTAEVVALYLQALAAQLTSAAVRFIPLAATQGQQVIARLAPLIAQGAQTTLKPARLTSAHLAADLAAMAHETLQPRIFRT